jgi:hypothetical protein
MRRALFAVALLASVPALAADTPVTVFPQHRPDLWFSATGDLDNTTDANVMAAATGVQQCVTSVQISSLVANIDVNVRLLSANTVIWTMGVDTAVGGGTSMNFEPPVCTIAGEALEIDVAEDPTDNLIFYNVQGYSSQ